MRTIISLLFLSLFFGCTDSDCISTKAAFDIGSGSTKIIVASVDSCKKTIIKVLYQEQKKIDYEESLTSSDSFPAPLIQDGINALKELKANADKYRPKAYFAVATEAFRNARNGKEVAQMINNTLNISTAVISQEQEAQLGFLAAKSQSVAKKIISWDIGGASMQLSNGKNIYQGKLASITFKNSIINNIQKNKNKTTPNPLSKHDREKAIKLAIKTADLGVPQSIKRSISTTRNEIIGIGSVHSNSIRKQLNKYKYTQFDVYRAIITKSGLNDKQIGGDYASTDYSNLCLVYGFMKGLGIKEVRAVKINLGHGLLLNNGINFRSIK